MLVKCITKEFLGAYNTYLLFCLVLKFCEALKQTAFVLMVRDSHTLEIKGFITQKSTMALLV